MSFGGGLNAYVRQVFVRRKGWVTDGEFVESLQVSQISPGPNVVNLTVSLANRLRGYPGSIAALVGIVLPAIAVNIAFAVWLGGSQPSGWVAALLAGFVAAAIGLTLQNVVDFVRRNVTGVIDLAMGIVVFIAVGVLNVNILVAVIGFGLVSVGVHFWRRARKPERDNDG